MKKFLLFFLLLSFTSSYALDVEEKLTLRFLSVSKTKKTVLINRGLEDGLVVGDHAKFFLTAGVIARGVVIKASPTRSIWSVYRIVKGEELVENKVLNLKIATPVKLTEDATKTFRSNTQVSVSRERISMPAEGVNLSDDEKSDLSSFEHSDDSSMSVEDMAVVDSGSFSSRTLEVWGIFNINSLSGESEQGESVFTSVSSSIDFSVGVEKYFNSKNSFLRNLSISLLLSSRAVKGGVSNVSSLSYLEYGFGFDYHFYNEASDYGKLIGYGGMSLGFGNASYETTSLNAATNKETTVTTDGASNFFSLGFGGKYYLRNGFGARLVLDYFKDGASFEPDVGDELILNLAGLRVRAGLSYRW